MSREHRTIWIFPDDGCWYEVGIPYGDKFAAALGQGCPKAWRVCLGALEKLVEAAK